MESNGSISREKKQPINELKKTTLLNSLIWIVFSHLDAHHHLLRAEFAPKQKRFVLEKADFHWLE